MRLLMEGESTSAEEKCSTLHRHYQTLVRDYKRLEKRLVECQRKQLEVSEHVSEEQLQVIKLEELS